MKRIFILTILFTSIIVAQEKFLFVNYGPQASKSEGDPNYLQIINFKLDDIVKNNIILQIFDPDCYDKNDSQFGGFNSQFRFSLYKGELSENQINFNIKVNTTLSPFHIYSKTFSNEIEYDNQWMNFVEFSTDSLIDNKFSLLITGIIGDDANAFKVRILDANTRNELDKVYIYSFQPTLRFLNEMDSYSFLIDEKHDNYLLNTFDFDGAKISINTLLKDNEILEENNPRSWSEIPINLNKFEKGNNISINIGKLKIIYNDLTFYLTDLQKNFIPINLKTSEFIKVDLPIVHYQINYKSCNDLVFSAENITNQKYTWLFEDGSTIEDHITNKKFSSSGNYECELFVEKESSAITKAIVKRIIFKVNEPPIAKAKGNIIAAPFEKLTFDASASFDKDGFIKSYIWNFENEVEISGRTVSYSFNKPGNYLVKLKVIDDFEYSCNTAEDSLIVFINSTPVIITQKEIKAAVNQLIKFDASKSYDKDGEIISYKWQIDNSIKDGSIIEHSFSKPGQYLVKLTVTDNSSTKNNFSTETIKVIINHPPKPIIKTQEVVAENEIVNFDASKSIDIDGNILSYNWEIKDSIISGQNINYTFNTPGNYKVKLVVKDDSETQNDIDSTFVNIVVNERPKAIIENDKYVVSNNVLFDGTKSFDSDGSITKYIWDFGDGTKSNEAKTYHTYKVPGKYFVTLKVIDNTNVKNNFSIDSSFVIINKKPIADAGKDYLIAPNTKINFSAINSVDPDGKIAKVKWYINNKLINENFNFEYNFAESGNYTLKLEVEDDFQKPLTDKDSARIIVNRSPIAKIDYVKKAIPNQKIKFDASNSYDSDGKITNYSWIIDNKKFDGKIIEYAFSQPGLYKVIIFIEDDSKVENSIGSDTVFVKINSSPVIKTTNEIFTCDRLVNFDASGSYDPDGDNILVTWKFPDTNEIMTGKNIFYYFKESGNYPVLLTLNDLENLPNSITEQIVNVIIHQPPIADAGNDTTVCTQDLIIFNGLKSKSFNNRILSFEWLFSDSTKYTGSTIVKTFDKEGLYNVVLKVTDDSNLPCNTSFDSKVIKVIDTPHANAGDDFAACVGIPIQFDGSKSTDIDGVVNSYSWDFGDGETGSGEKPNHIYNKSGDYKVILTITGDSKGDCGNTSQDELIVTVSEGPIANFTAIDSTDENTKIIFDASKSFTPQGKIICYDWDFGDGNYAVGKIVEHSYKNYGNYIVTLRIETDNNSICNTAFSSFSIFVNKKPSAKIISPKYGSTNENILFDASLSFDPNGQIRKYIWDFGDGSSIDGIKVYHTFLNSGKYIVKLKVVDDTNTKNNFSTDEIEIKINSSPFAKFLLNEKYFIDELINLDASLSSDNDGKIINYKWFVDDKFYSSNKADVIKFTNEGVYVIKLIVEDDSEVSNRYGILTKLIQIINK